MKNAGRAVNDNAEPAKAATALEPAEDSWSKRQTLDRPRQHELSGMDSERLAALEPNRAGASTSSRRTVGIQVWLLVALEDDEGLAEAKINGTGSQSLV